MKNALFTLAMLGLLLAVAVLVGYGMSPVPEAEATGPPATEWQGWTLISSQSAEMPPAEDLRSMPWGVWCREMADGRSVWLAYTSAGVDLEIGSTCTQAEAP